MLSMAASAPMTIRGDEALADAARGGDRAAFSELIARYRPIAVAYARARLGSLDEGEDAAQDAFVRAYQSLEQYRGAGCWGAWFMTILRNQVNDRLRRLGIRRTIPLDPQWGDPSPGPDRQLFSKVSSAELVALVDAMPEHQRVPLVMRYGSGMTIPQIALALDTKESTVAGRLTAGLKILRRRLMVEIPR
jgi:RNA polymerase sigma-70 factor, ECF subfamily